MYAFTLERPASVADAAKLIAAGAKALAGGQTLLASMKLRLSAPDQLVDLSGIGELTGIKRDGDSFTVGAMSRHLDGGVRVAVTGAGNGVFRHKGLEDALNQSFTAASAASVKIDAGDLNSDLHASAAYRANLISVLTQRAVTKALG
jgi:CO/xanthine dehydrogenase FAD-binding subunit